MQLVTQCEIENLKQYEKFAKQMDCTKRPSIVKIVKSARHVVVGKKGILGCSGRTMNDGGYMIVRPYFSCDYFKNKHAE